MEKQIVSSKQFKLMIERLAYQLIENHFELVTFKEFNNIRNDIINNN